ncbi:MAG TPA: hypothetical protein VNU72_05875, partial [Puia sp.]|nr:hypothetical protein [Puia sp.]
RIFVLRYTMKHSFRSLLAGNYDAIPAAVAGFIIIQAFAAHGGIGVSPDSVVYMSTAANIRDHALINDFTNMPVMDFPALYPIFLSGVILLSGHSILAAGPILNGLLFAALIWLCGWMMERFPSPSKWYKWPLLLFIVLSPCLLEVYSMIWSETLFLLLSLFFIIACHRYFQSHSMPSLVIAGVIAGLACVTRYAGVALIGMGGLLMLFDRTLPFKKGSVGKKIGHLLLFGLIALLPLVLNLWRNYRLTGTLTGYREKGLTPFGTNLHDFGSVFCDWLPFFNERYGWASVVAVFFTLLITGLFVFRLVRKKDFFSYDTIAISLFVVYAGFILASATFSRFQQLDSRLLSPLFLPWLWGSTCWIPAQIVRVRERTRPIWMVVAIVGAGCFVLGEWRNPQLSWNGIHYAGIPGYTEDQWTLSETMKFVRTNKPLLATKGTIYSNAFEGLWFLADTRSELIPHRDSPDDINYLMKEARFTVIWFNDAENDDLIDINYIRRHRKLENEYHFSDGTVYFFTKETPATAH